MTENKLHYSKFNVMTEAEYWDPHTRKIVEQRLATSSFFPYRFFTQAEANTLFELCAQLLDDRRTAVIAFVIYHFDTTLKASIGESQRKLGVPKLSVLMRDGLALLDEACIRLYGSTLDLLADEVRQKIVTALMQGHFQLQSGAKSVPVKDFMQKVLSEAVSAYYSHPVIWSEIGYAGPAYPRGYVRTGLGLTDPWEAKSDDN